MEKINAGEILRKGFLSTSAEETMLIAEAFAAELSDGDFVALSGDLGTGKTTFVKGLARGLGVVETVKSPSFNICAIYPAKGGKTLVHVDAYRLSGAEDFENLLIDEIVSGEKIVCVEWAEAIGESLPKNAHKIDISTSGEIHKITLKNV